MDAKRVLLIIGVMLIFKLNCKMIIAFVNSTLFLSILDNNI